MNPIPIDRIRAYFEEKFATYGPTPAGVDWNSPASQTIRFEQLVRVCNPDRPLSLNEFGCGYGALVDYLLQRGWQFTYAGYDLVEASVRMARSLHPDSSRYFFSTHQAELPVSDYTTASGIFNIKLDTSPQAWTEFILATLHEMNQLNKRGFSFNCLTSYSDPNRMQPQLYYADPGQMFDYCKKNFSKNVALLHDYGLYDFTILVRKILD
jgi:SAM-dependent methyltransferase